MGRCCTHHAADVSGGNGFTMTCVPDNPANRARAAALLSQGGVVAYPTDTLYGLGAAVFDPHAVAKVFAMKRRDSSEGLPVLIASVEQLSTVASDLTPDATALAERFWPGPLTLVLKRHPALPASVCGGGGTVAVRVPGHPTPRDLIAACGSPITGTSANVHGGAEPTTADDVAAQLGESVPLVLDGGRCEAAVASTIVDATRSPVRVLRVSALPLKQLRLVCEVAEQTRATS